MKRSILLMVFFLLTIQVVAQAHMVWEGDITVDVYGHYDTDLIDITAGATVNLYDPGYLGI